MLSVYARRSTPANAALDDAQFVVPPRLQWLAPYRAASADGVVSRAQLQAMLAVQFETVPMPVLVAAVRVEQGGVVETGRGFIVPGNWRARAAALRG